MWSAISDFITDLVSIFYRTADDVSRDHELQSWVKDIHENGFPTREEDVDHDFPKNLQSREQLIHVLTSIVFTCTCQHAAVNFSQMEITAFVPNVPPVMRLPPPTRKSEANLKMIMETLPNKSQAGWHIATVYTLTRIAEDEVMFDKKESTMRNYWDIGFSSFPPKFVRGSRNKRVHLNKFIS